MHATSIQAMVQSFGPMDAPSTGMKMFLLLLLSVAAVFVWQRGGDREAANKGQPAAAVAPATPRPVYEHDWAKHSLDRAHEVAAQVQQTRKENEQP